MISIIIPTYNEQETILELLLELEKTGEKKEIIVVDGGSSDNTRKLAQQKAKLVCHMANRSEQMNYGAKLARGQVLWFLHADSKIAPNSLQQISQASKKYAFGGFSLCFDSPKISLKLIAFFSNLRARFFGLIFGDQALFINKDFFFQLGGFTSLELMEDFDFCRRAKQIAPPIILRSKIKTSARRFLQKGIWKTFFLMQYIKILYLCGIPSSKLKQLYTR